MLHEWRNVKQTRKNFLRQVVIIVASAPVSLRRHYPDQVIWGMFSASIASTPNLGLSKIGRCKYTDFLTKMGAELTCNCNGTQPTAAPNGRHASILRQLSTETNGWQAPIWGQPTTAPRVGMHLT
jgi:hypothetical protein